jgi:hypothetical protein
MRIGNGPSDLLLGSFGFAGCWRTRLVFRGLSPINCFAPGRRRARLSKRRTAARATGFHYQGVDCEQRGPGNPYWLRLLAATEIVPADKLSALTEEANQMVAILTTIVNRPPESTP